MNFIRRHFTGSVLLALSVLASLSLPAQAQQKLVPTQSEIVFVSKQMGVPVEGYFKKFDAQIAFDPAKLQTSKIAFTVEMASATLGVPEADAELPKPVWFNVPGFPKATFQSSTIKALGGGKYEVAGQLTIKGRAHPVTVPVALTQAGGTTTATGLFTIKRLAYAIGENQWSDTSMVADDVQVKFKLALTGVGKV
jgi:polyisoprenoid-binding protein YceI